MKLQTPELPNKSAMTEIDAKRLKAEATLEQVFLHGVDASDLVAKHLSFDESLLEKVMFVQAKLEWMGLLDSELRGCDLSAANCTNASFIRARMTSGRLTGVDFSRATLKDVTFEGCKLDMANFRFAKLTRVRFIDCTMAETDFLMAELHDVVFESCMLDRVEFAQSTIDKVDVRSSQLLDLRGWEYLKGLTVDSAQLVTIAPQLALALGLNIKD